MSTTIKIIVTDDEAGTSFMLGAHGADLEDAVIATQDQLFALLPDRPDAA